MFKSFSKKDIVIVSIACVYVIGAGHKTAPIQEEISFQDDYGNRNLHYTCLSHGEFCTDGDGIYAQYGDPNGPAS